MLNGYNLGTGLAVPDPLHRFPSVRQVQPKFPIVFSGRHFGINHAAFRFFLEEITRVFH
jgi:hypothetical protein